MRQLTTVLFILVAVVQQAFSQVEHGKFRFSADVGFGYRLGSTPEGMPEDFEEYFQDLRSGAFFKGSASYQIGASWGAGLQFNRFLSQESAFLNVGNGFVIATADNIRISYIAPHVFFNNTSSNGLHTVASKFSVGYLRFTNNTNVDSDFFELKANSIGVGMGINYDFHINDYIAIGAGLDLFLGSYGEFEIIREIDGREVSVEQNVSDVSEEDRENLSTVALTIGVKVYL